MRIRDAIDVPFVRLGPGDLFGGLPLLGEIGHPETAVASEDLELIEIDAHAFRYLRTSRPWLAHRLAAAMVRIHVERSARALDAALARS